jgi:hypothetical protein
MAYGQDGHIGISFQESFGTQYVSSMDYFSFISEGITENIESLMSESLQSRYDEPDDYEGMHGIEGDIAFEVHPHMVGKLLKAWCGQSSEFTEVGSCYAHNFVPAEADWEDGISALPPMSIEVYRDTGSAYLYFDMLLNQLVFEIAQGTLYKATASFIGAQFSWLAKSVPSYEAGSFFAWDTVSLSIGGSGVNDASQLTITLNNNLAGKAFLDLKKYPSRILRDGFRTVEVAGTLLLDGDAQARIYKARTQQRLVMTATDPTTVALGHNALEIDVPKMLYTEFPANIGGSGLVEVGFSAKGKYDSTSSYAVQFTLVNTTPIY